MSERQADAKNAPVSYLRDVVSPADAGITPAMLAAGVERLSELLEAGTSSRFVVSEIFQAMVAAREQTQAIR